MDFTKNGKSGPNLQRANFEILNCGQVDLYGSRLRILRTSQGSLFGTKTQRGSSGFFVNHQGPK